jgi:hypothetical protein
MGFCPTLFLSEWIGFFVELNFDLKTSKMSFKASFLATSKGKVTP